MRSIPAFEFELVVKGGGTFINALVGAAFDQKISSLLVDVWSGHGE